MSDSIPKPPARPAARIPSKPIALTRDKPMLETDVEGNNRTYAKKKGVMFEKFTSPSKRSVPDDILTFPNGLIAFIEYKAPGKRATPKQWLDHQKRRAMGCLVYVVDNPDVGRRVIEELLFIDSNRNLFLNTWARNRDYYTDKNVVEK